MQESRGNIHSPGRAAQLRDFSGLRYGNITPTDIDGLIEYKNLGYILLELKYLTPTLDPGQELALERLTDDLERSGKSCCCIIAVHNVENTKQMIPAADTIVYKYRRRGKWIIAGENLLTKILMQRFIALLERLR